MDYNELKAFINKYPAITMQTAAKLFRETNNFVHTFKESLDIAKRMFTELQEEWSKEY